MKQLILLRNPAKTLGLGSYAEGQTVTVDDVAANALLAIGCAVLTKEQPKPIVVEAEPVDKATAKVEEYRTKSAREQQTKPTK